MLTLRGFRNGSRHGGGLGRSRSVHLLCALALLLATAPLSPPDAWAGDAPGPRHPLPGGHGWDGWDDWEEGWEGYFLHLERMLSQAIAAQEGVAREGPARGAAGSSLGQGEDDGTVAPAPAL